MHITLFLWVKQNKKLNFFSSSFVIELINLKNYIIMSSKNIILYDSTVHAFEHTQKKYFFIIFLLWINGSVCTVYTIIHTIILICDKNCVLILNSFCFCIVPIYKKKKIQNVHSTKPIWWYIPKIYVHTVHYKYTPHMSIMNINRTRE